MIITQYRCNLDNNLDNYIYNYNLDNYDTRLCLIRVDKKMILDNVSGRLLGNNNESHLLSHDIVYPGCYSGTIAILTNVSKTGLALQVYLSKQVFGSSESSTFHRNF